MLNNQSLKIKSVSTLLVVGVIWFAGSACFPVYTPPRPTQVDVLCPPNQPPTQPCPQPSP